MKKIVIAGAGAYHFAPALLEDLFIRDPFPCELWLVDADLDMAELTARAMRTLANQKGIHTEFYYTTQLFRAIPGADAVVVQSDFLDEEAWKKDFEALDAVGLGKQVRLNGGLGGMFQTLRASGFIADVAETMAQSCENPILLLCDSGFGGLQLSRACEAARIMGIRTYGISGVWEQTRTRLSLYLDVPVQELEVSCAGLNGFSWVSSLSANGEDLLPRCKKEIQEDSREELAAQFIDFYDAVPAGDRVMQYEMLADTPVNPRRTVVYSGVGEADYELRKRQLASLTVYGDSGQGREALTGILNTGLHSVRPITILKALWCGKPCTVKSLVYPCDGAVAGVTMGRFVEGEARVSTNVNGVLAELPVELDGVLHQVSLCNYLYALAATGDRDALREAMEIDPALAGIDILYAEDVVDARISAMHDRLPRWFPVKEEGEHVPGGEMAGL